jgi:CBS domain-containing protein
MIDREALLSKKDNPNCLKVADLFGAYVPITALQDETRRTIATRLAIHGLERLPVVTDAQTRRLAGIVSLAT